MSNLHKCCEGSTYVLPADHGLWAVICRTCDRVLAHHRGTREEVYADL